MVKKYYLLTLTIFGINVASAADLYISADTTKETGHVSYSLGTSIPMGKFGSTDYFERGAGYAMTGIAIEISLTRKIHGGPYSWCISSRSNVNLANEMALINDMNYADPGYGYDVQWGTYSLGSLMAGAKMNIKAIEKITIVPRVMFGLAVCNYPEMLVRSSWNSSFWHKELSATATTFSSLIGLGLDAKIGRNIKLLANLDFQQAFPLFVDVEQLYSNGTRDFTTVSQRMNTLSLTVGLAAELK